MGCVLILVAAAGAVAVVLALRLWLVLHSRVVVPRESVSLMAVAGSGKSGLGLQTPECTTMPSFGRLCTLCALHSENCSLSVSPETAPARHNAVGGRFRAAASVTNEHLALVGN